jgi:3-deoxy-D-manno-octulosonic-acid transferase
MEVLYYIGVKLYGLGIVFLSLFNTKARQWVSGRRNWQEQLRKTLRPDEKRIHIHCPSLGEFEQGKPVLEALRKNFPAYKIVLTFFSPSGYEIRKKDPNADYVFYLPLDGPVNSKKFIEIVNPRMSFFVKYDFWHFYIKEFKNKKIPVYFVSTIFRPSQIYFQPYGKFFDKMLRRVTHFFVQNQESLELLYKQGIPQVSVTGDTRIDRVYQNSLVNKSIPEIENFKLNKKLIVAGSTWHPDEKILIQHFNKVKDDFKMVIVPHEISESSIRRLLNKAGNRSVKFSELKNNKQDFDILIIDNVGMLSSLYRYADIAYVGGGFGKGIHNILEAAVFGIPVFFGPRFRKFREARELVHWKGAFSIKNEADFSLKFEEVMNEPARLKRIKEINDRYISNNKGSTELIINFLKINLPDI